MKYTLQYHPDAGWSEDHLRAAEKALVADLAARGVAVDMPVPRFTTTWRPRGDVFLVQTRDCAAVFDPAPKLEFRFNDWRIGGQ